MALRPIHGRAVWARSPVSVTSMRIVPWQPASMPASVGSPSSATSAGEQLGPVAEEVPQAVVDGRHLLAGVEDVGDVDRRLGPPCGPARASPPGRPSCRSHRGPRGCRPRGGPTALPLAGTVSVCPASTSRIGRSSVVRATRLSPTRSTVSHGTARSSPSSQSTRSASWWLTDGVSTRWAVRSSRSVIAVGPDRPESLVISVVCGLRRRSARGAMAGAGRTPRVGSAGCRSRARRTRFAIVALRWRRWRCGRGGRTAGRRLRWRRWRCGGSGGAAGRWWRRPLGGGWALRGGRWRPLAGSLGRRRGPAGRSGARPAGRAAVAGRAIAGEASLLAIVAAAHRGDDEHDGADEEEQATTEDPADDPGDPLGEAASAERDLAARRPRLPEHPHLVATRLIDVEAGEADAVVVAEGVGVVGAVAALGPREHLA